MPSVDMLVGNSRNIYEICTKYHGLFDDSREYRGTSIVQFQLKLHAGSGGDRAWGLGNSADGNLPVLTVNQGELPQGTAS